MRVRKIATIIQPNVRESLERFATLEVPKMNPGLPHGEADDLESQNNYTIFRV